MPTPQLFDNHGRSINYLRLAVTDRCNLRCFYCMPENGIVYAPRKDLMTYEEMLRVVRLLSEMGVNKVRITGGEPFVRRGMLGFLRALRALPKIEKINLTTNGTLTAALVPELQKIGVQTVNLSLDSLNRERFFEITRRDELPNVLKTLDALLQHDFKVKINTVVMAGKNIEDLIPMVELAKNHPIDVRFIEEMPFNGEGSHYAHLDWNYHTILAFLKSHFPDLQKLPDEPSSTSYNYKIPNYQGSVGVIAAYSRTFCGTCNRIRITPKGGLKTCLYDDGVFNVKDLMRSGASDNQLQTAFLEALGNRAKDGYEAEKRRNFGLPVSESMSTIGG